MKRFIFLLYTVAILTACGEINDPHQAFEQGHYERAFELWTPEAEAGDLEAMNYLGVHYMLGLGIRKDYQKAIEWYEKAATAGHPDAQRNIGDMYSNGLGVAENKYQAFIWYFAASQQGNESAKNRLEILSGSNKLTPHQQTHGKIEANNYITDPQNRFMSHDTYIDKKTKLDK